MKRSRWIQGVAGFAGVALTLAGCSVHVENAAEISETVSPAEETSGYTPLKERVQVDSLTSNFAKAVWRMMNAAEDAVKAVEQYVDLPEEETLRAAGGAGLPDIQALGKYLPRDLTTLKRRAVPKTAQPRNVSDTEIEETGVEETITLQDELDVIIEDFNKNMEFLTPSLEGVPLAEGVRVENGFIYLSDDEVVAQNTLAGIAVAEVFIAIANGEDAEAASRRISSEIERMFTGENPETQRGFYIKPIPLWNDATVYYKWGDMRDGFKRAVRKAMDRWESATNREVRFTEFDESAWEWFLVVIGVRHIVRIEEKDLDGTQKGLASPGSYPWGIAFMQLDQNRCSNSNQPGSDTAYSVALHELGHVLGLQHEHQRYDRDTYIEVTGSESNYWKIPEITIGTDRIELVWKKTKVFGITVWYPCIVVRTVWLDLFAKTAWDFNSIMLYSGFPIKPSYRNTYGAVTKYNTELSANDIAIVKRLY